MFCKSCGNKIDDDSQFCSSCGTKQSEKNKPTFGNEANMKEESKTVDVNLSFGRRKKTDKNQKIYNADSERKYDPSYSKDSDATIIGILIIIGFFLFAIFPPFKFDNIDSINQFLRISLIGTLVLRIIITVWVVNIAKRQNREIFGWGLLAFFFPSIALIIIGTLKKIFAKFEIDNTLSDEDNSVILFKKAQVFNEYKKYSECIRFAEKAFELDPNNKRASDLVVTAQLPPLVNELSNKNIQVVFRETKDNKTLKIISKNYQTIGASVLINDEIAPDGLYHYINDNRILIIKDGKIKQMIN